MTHRLLIRYVATVVVVVFAVGIWSTGGELDVGWLRFFAAAVLVATALLWVWEAFLWKVRFAQRIRGVPRDLSGTWKGMLESFWKDPKTGKPPAPKPAYLVVRQTASTVSVILLTDESKAVSSLGVVTSGDGVASLDYMYLNRPDSRFEHRSRMHHGSTSLDITGLPPTRLQGRYWTDRESQGELDFNERRKRAVDDFEEATALFQAAAD